MSLVYGLRGLRGVEADSQRCQQEQGPGDDGTAAYNAQKCVRPQGCEERHDGRCTDPYDAGGKPVPRQQVPTAIPNTQVRLTEPEQEQRRRRIEGNEFHPGIDEETEPAGGHDSGGQGQRNEALVRFGEPQLPQQHHLCRSSCKEVQSHGGARSGLTGFGPENRDRAENQANKGAQKYRFPHGQWLCRRASARPDNGCGMFSHRASLPVPARNPDRDHVEARTWREPG